jgi:hypothetical protein
MSETNQNEAPPDYTEEELKQAAQIKEWLLETFSYPKIQNEQTNELVKGMASLLHAAATMIVKTQTRQREGLKAIELLQEALLFYISGQTAKVSKPE